MKQTHLFIACFLIVASAPAQVKWSVDSIPPSQSWNNYSTTFLGDIDTRKPLLVCAIPYNGNYSNSMSNAPLALDFPGSLFTFKSTLSDRTQRLYTYDSSAVYFLTPGIFPENAGEYEYRVLRNGKEVLVPWSSISRFSDLQLNTFRKGFGFLGGFKADWGSYIAAELRRKGDDTSFALTAVQWQESAPAVSRVFTTRNLNEFFALLQRPWEGKAGGLAISNDLEFSSADNTIIFYLSGEVFKRTAIEYQLTRNGKIWRRWSFNDFDNNFIWLKDLAPGSYRLDIRFSRQRHKPVSYPFRIRPQWHQTTTFKFLIGSLLAAFLGFIFFLFRSVRQKRRLLLANREQERLRLQIQSIQSQLNPHFLFNALSSIQWLINKKNIDAANEYLAEFSRLLRQSLQAGERETIPLQEEVAMMKIYLSLESLRAPVHYRFEVSDDVSNVNVPGFLIQPILENAVKHGTRPDGSVLQIETRFFRSQDDLCMTITDNGKGFDVSTAPEGLGIRLTRQRISALTEKTGNLVLFKVESNAATGTTVQFNFTNWLQ